MDTKSQLIRRPPPSSLFPPTPPASLSPPSPESTSRKRRASPRQSAPQRRSKRCRLEDSVTTNPVTHSSCNDATRRHCPAEPAPSPDTLPAPSDIKVLPQLPQQSPEQPTKDMEPHHIIIDNNALPPRLGSPPIPYNPRLGEQVCALWERKYSKNSTTERVRRACRIKKYGLEVVDQYSPGSTPDEERRAWEGRERTMQEEREKDLQCWSDSAEESGTGD